jgi:hypothetical protein
VDKKLIYRAKIKIKQKPEAKIKGQNLPINHKPVDKKLIYRAKITIKQRTSHNPADLRPNPRYITGKTQPNVRKKENPQIHNTEKSQIPKPLTNKSPEIPHSRNHRRPAQRTSH